MPKITDFNEKTQRQIREQLAKPLPSAIETVKVAEKPICERNSHGLRLVIKGQVRGGKNNMGFTKTGKHYPKSKFCEWRRGVIEQIRNQLPNDFEMIKQPVNVGLEYVAGDRRRRDFPAICDALWHCLERAGVVEDDVFIWVKESSRSYDKQNPRAIIEFLP